MTKQKRTPEQFTAAKKFAVEVSGYGPNSPIWGKRLPDVITGVEEEVREGILRMENGDYSDAKTSLLSAILTIDELKKRLAKGAIISSQMK